MIIAFGGIKGGAGKTTLATNITVMRSFIPNNTVVLVDGDDQRSSTDWSNQRKADNIETPWLTVQLVGRECYKDMLKLQNKYDDVIIDIGGRDTFTQRAALTVADIFIIPFKPRSLDIWTHGQVKQLISEASISNKKIKSYSVINQGDPQGSDNAQAIEILSECSEIKCIPYYISHRKAFSNAAASGLSVLELRPQDKKAIQEIQALHDFIYGK